MEDDDSEKESHQAPSCDCSPMACSSDAVHNINSTAHAKPDNLVASYLTAPRANQFLANYESHVNNPLDAVSPAMDTAPVR